MPQTLLLPVTQHHSRCPAYCTEVPAVFLMPNPTEVPTPAALADLVARCNEMQRYSTELTAAEETRVAALANAIVTMRQVLELVPVPSEIGRASWRERG